MIDGQIHGKELSCLNLTFYTTKMPEVSKKRRTAPPENHRKYALRIFKHQTVLVFSSIYSLYRGRE